MGACVSGGQTSAPSTTNIEPKSNKLGRENTHLEFDSKDEKKQSLAVSERKMAKVSHNVCDDYAIPSVVVSDKEAYGERKGQFQAVLFPGFSAMGRKTCQDAFAVAKIRGASNVPFQFFGIFDGHGPRGELVSDYLVRQLAISLQGQLKMRGNAIKSIQKAFVKSFVEIDEKLSETVPDLELSGSTATCVLLSHDTLHLSWVGDSKAVLASVDSEGFVFAQNLTREHNFADKKERERARKKGAQIRHSANDVEKDGPLRVYEKGKLGPGLAVSRSFGDAMAHRVGVSTLPEMKSLSIKPEHHFIIMASDGVWDQMSAEEACEFIYRQKGAPDATEKLVLECASRWLDKNEGLSDDVVAIVTYLNAPLSDLGPRSSVVVTKDGAGSVSSAHSDQTRM